MHARYYRHDLSPPAICRQDHYEWAGATVEGEPLLRARAAWEPLPTSESGCDNDSWR